MINYAVCMATYNGADYLDEQIYSIVSQLNPYEKLFISDDGSQDDTLKIIGSFGDKVQLVASSYSGGVVSNFERVLTAAYNSGAKNIILSDQDDIWMKDRMKDIRTNLDLADIIMMNGYITDSELNPTGNTIFEGIGVSKGFFANFLRPTYVGCCMAFRREVLDVALPFPRSLPWHDWYLSLIGELFFNVKLVSNPSIYYRRHGNNHSDTGGISKNSFFKKIILRYRMLFGVIIASCRRIKCLMLKKSEDVDV